ncbi:MAG TPA: hypothetical protein VNN75_11680 [Stellaceae bacterium]|nr:hypothetical protein [Stellaceae bacterium]
MPFPARTGYRARQRLSFLIGRNAELALQSICAAFVLAERFTAAAAACVGAHQRALPRFGQRFEGHQPAPGLDRGFVVTGGILQPDQPFQDVTDRRKRAVSRRYQPFLKRLGGDIEISEEISAVQIGCHLQLATLL